jgi:signal transduction histidine kinase
MAVTRQSRRRSLRLAALLFVVTVPSALTLVWLGIRLLEQDRALVKQQSTERRAAALQDVVRSLEARLLEVERYLADGPVPPGLVRMTLAHGVVEAVPANRVDWLPQRDDATAETDAFDAGEAAEFKGRTGEALASYRSLQSSGDAVLLAGALLRQGRIHQAEGRWVQALSDYRELASAPRGPIAGAPADLHARRQICATLERAHRAKELEIEAAALEQDLLAGKWRLDGPAWELTLADLQRWTGRPVVTDPQRRQMSQVAEALWQRGVPPAAVAALREVVPAEDVRFTVLRGMRAGTHVALVIPPTAFAEWQKAAAASLPASTRISIDSEEKDGAAPASPGAITMIARSSDTGLPWAVRMTSSVSEPLPAELAGRSRVLAGGLVATLVLVVGGSYMLWRVMRREAEVARLQTEFISAVSHEFRTPLTSLRHATELLQESDELPAEQRRSFYGAMESDTSRLQRLVESLLDFSRMEEGRKAYVLRPTSAPELVRGVVDEFRDRTRGRGAVIDLDATEEPLSINADASSLSHAIWNLLDNAVKYSPESPAVRVSLRRSGGDVEIAIADRGIGIPAGEQPDIFHRFVRGAHALKRMAINGISAPFTGVQRSPITSRETRLIKEKRTAGRTAAVIRKGLNDFFREVLEKGRITIVTAHHDMA